MKRELSQLLYLNACIFYQDKIDKQRWNFKKIKKKILFRQGLVPKYSVWSFSCKKTEANYVLYTVRKKSAKIAMIFYSWGGVKVINR